MFLVFSEDVSFNKTICSLTPPASEIGNDDHSDSSFVSTSEDKKRKTDASSIQSRVRSKTRRTVGRPRARVVPHGLNAPSSINAGFSNLEPMQEEFEVRKIQDFIKKMVSFILFLLSFSPTLQIVCASYRL